MPMYRTVSVSYWRYHYQMYLHLKSFSYPGVINSNKLVPFLPKNTNFNNSFNILLNADGLF